MEEVIEIKNTFLSSLIEERISFFRNEIEKVEENIQNPDLYEGTDLNKEKLSLLQEEEGYWHILKGLLFKRSAVVSNEVIKNTIIKLQDNDAQKLNEATEKYLAENDSELKNKHNGEMCMLINRLKRIKAASNEITQLLNNQ